MSVVEHAMLKALARIIYKVEEAAAIICGVEYNEDGGGYTPAGRFCGHSIYCDRGLRALAGGVLRGVKLGTLY